MILRSQPQPQPPATRSRTQPLSIRQVMKQHDLQVQKQNTNIPNFNNTNTNNNILPPSLTNPYFPQNPNPNTNNNTNSMIKNIMNANMPIYPPNHIDSEPSIQLEDIGDVVVRDRTPPRRRKIFQRNDASGRANVQATSPMGMGTGITMRSSQPAQIPSQPPLRAQAQSYPSPTQTQQSLRKQKQNESITTPPLNSSASVYNTVPSMKKTKDNRNNTIYQSQQQHPNQQGSNFVLQPSGISLRSRRQPSVSFNQSHSQSQDIKQPVQLQQSATLKTTKSKMIAQNNSNPNNNNNAYRNSLENPPILAPKTSQPSSNPINRLQRTVAVNPPVPVYQSEFHKQINPTQEDEIFRGMIGMGLGSMPADRDRDSRSNAYQPYYTNMEPTRKGTTSQPQQNNRLLDALVGDYRQYEAKQTERSPNLPSHNSSAAFNSPSFAYNFPNSIHDGSITTNQPITMAPYNYYLQQPQPQQMLSPPTPASAQIYSVSSPFQQKQQQQLRTLPRRIQQIQNKVLQHDREIADVSKKMAENQVTDLESQKTLLTQLIQKQEQLNQKQRQINDNLEQMAKIQWDSNLKKQQILRYELQIQQAKRLQQLQNQNQRLIHEILRRQKQKQRQKQKMYININTSTQNTKDLSILPHQEANRSISFLRGNRSWAQEWNQGDLRELLSPFAVKPEYY